MNQQSILAALVIRNINLNDSVSYQSFTKCVKTCRTPISLLVVDNSDVQNQQKIDEETIPEYCYCGNKDKLAGAYNKALEIANKKHCDWLLLLDDDTELSEEYFIKLSEFLSAEKINPNIASVVPFLANTQKKLSPEVFRSHLWWDKKVTTSGIQQTFTVAFNSVALLKVDFLNEIDGFSRKYPLDMLDHWMCLQIYQCHRYINVLDTEIKHQLSVASYEKNVSIERHKSILDAERLITKEMGKSYYLSYKIRLFIRMVKHFILLKNKRYARMDFQILFNIK